MIILLNGPINAGKTTVGRELAKAFEDGAHVELDDLHGFLTDTPLEAAIPITLENAVSVTSNLVERGFDVVLTYPLSTADFEYLASNLSPLDADVYAVTLSPPLDVALSNRGERELDEWERNRIEELYEMGVHRPEFGVRVDNAGEPPSETVAKILRRIREGDIEPAVRAGETLEPTEHVNEWTSA
jgi:adenylate kinase family enzyme